MGENQSLEQMDAAELTTALGRVETRLYRLRQRRDELLDHLHDKQPVPEPEQDALL